MGKIRFIWGRLGCRPWWLFLAVILCLAVEQAGGTDRGTEPLQLIVLGADRQLERQIDSILTTANTELAVYGGMSITDTVTVLMATRREQFDSTVGGNFPDWGLGCAIPQRNTIVILSPYLFPYQKSLAEVLRHELAHIYLHKLVGWPRIPRWMDEGFAMILGHEWRFGDDWIVARAVFARETMPLLHIEGLNRFKQAKARLAYNQSYLAMGYFLGHYGWESFLLFLRELRRTNDWDDAFMEAIGSDYAGFQDEYNKFLEEKYTWASLLSDTMLLWLLLVFLVLVLYLLKRRRMKAKVAEWERAAPTEDIFYPAREGPPDQPGR